MQPGRTACRTKGQRRVRNNTEHKRHSAPKICVQIKIRKQSLCCKCLSSFLSKMATTTRHLLKITFSCNSTPAVGSVYIGDVIYVVATTGISFTSEPSCTPLTSACISHISVTVLSPCSHKTQAVLRGRRKNKNKQQMERNKNVKAIFFQIALEKSLFIDATLWVGVFLN